MPREISSIMPEIRKIGKNKKIIAGRTTEQQPEEIKFYYNTSEYDSYAKEGFNPPPNNERFDVKEGEFLKSVNLEYGKIKVKILDMIRQKQLILRVIGERGRST